MGKHQAHIRHDYFNTVSTPVQAYLLGFLMADGYIDLKLNAVRLHLKLTDENSRLLDFMRTEIAPTVPIHSIQPTNGYSSLHLRIYSTQLLTDLARFGVCRQKTGKEQWPKLLPSNLAAPFVLGYFDGDGHITYHATQHRWEWAVCCASRTFLVSMQTEIARHGITLRGPYENNGIWRLASGKISTVTQLDAWLHESGLGFESKNLAKRIQAANYSPPE